MKISLLYPKWTTDYGLVSHFAKKASVWPPLNLAYLAAVAEKDGHEVNIIDGEVEKMSLDKMVEETSNLNPDIIGITATTPFYHIAVDLARKLKEKTDIPIAIGGHHITVLRERAFDKAFDYAFIGEAEKSFPIFLKEYEKNKKVTNVPGMLYRNGDEIISTGPTEIIQDLDSIPFPARHLLNYKNYYIGTLKGNKNFTTVMTMRGCPYKCIFCNTDVFGNKIRKRSPERVVEEIKEIKDKYGINHIIFLDDTFTVDKRHVMDLCDRIVKEDLKITFDCGTRANKIDEELVAKMVEAGMIRISYGLETTDSNIRRIIKKEVPLESYDIANKLTNKYGVETLNSCMIGLPGESEETVRKTLAYLRNSREIKQANISIAIPYPGTELYEMARREENGLKLLTEDFSKYRRYNSAVMNVGNFTPQDLIDIQNEAFASIYLAPWRWKPMMKKSGILGSFLTFTRLVKTIMKGKTRFITNKQLGIKDKNNKQRI